MKRMLTALAMCGAVLAATACTADEEPAEDGSPTVADEAQDAADAAADAEEDTGAGAPGSCEDPAVTAAMADLVASAEVEFSVDDSSGDTLSCTWDSGSDVGPMVIFTASPTVSGSAMSETLLESMGQEIVQDSRFDGVDAIPTVVLGCENGDSSGIMGCAIAVYGTEGGADITVQALMADVTQDQLVDAAWMLTESFNR